MTVRELRVAMIGGGFMGRAHALAYAMLPIAYQLPATIRRQVVVDVTDQLAAAAAASFGFAEWDTDWQAAVRRDDIDIVDIVTPNDAHEPIAIAAADAGKHVLCEKPLARDADAAERMWQHAERAGVVHMAGFNYRHTPAIAYTRQLLEQGTLGAPYQLRITYLQDWGLGGSPLVWRFDRRRAGSGALGDIGSHAIDCAEYLLGPIRRVMGRLATLTPTRERPGSPGELATVDVDDIATFMAEFESGATGVFVASRHALARKNRMAFELDAERGAVRFDWDVRDELELALADDTDAVGGFRTLSMGPSHPDPWWPIAGMGSGCLETSTNQLRDFLRAIVDGGRARPDFGDATRVQQVVDAVIASAERDAWVGVKRTLPVPP
ncbi:MAG: Gfo/Idh/MocA family oxidoreductase [Chloroflexi bacterium]|nr:Gfo/Idh/MocA family oxidoreductase [Chloroflexota bacterium]